MLSGLLLPLVSVGVLACGSEVVPTVAELYTAAYIGSDGDYEVFKGYIGGMFEITVDGVSYEDSESWYNAEMEKIPARLEAAGYEGDNFDFQAEVGLDDFWNKTKVNVASTSKTGFQGSSTVTPADGSFEIRLPSNSFGNYQIKSVKRLNLVLPTGEIFCYNMKGTEKSYTLNMFTDPIIISGFTTSITRYKCASTDDSGILIDPAQTINDKLVKDMSRDQVNEALGAPWLVDISTSTYSPMQTWYYPEFYSGDVPESATANSKTYSCKLVFKKIETSSEEGDDDEEMGLYSVDKCNQAIIDYVNW